MSGYKVNTTTDGPPRPTVPSASLVSNLPTDSLDQLTSNGSTRRYHLYKTLLTHDIRQVISLTPRVRRRPSAMVPRLTTDCEAVVVGNLFPNMEVRDGAHAHAFVGRESRMAEICGCLSMFHLERSEPGVSQESCGSPSKASEKSSLCAFSFGPCMCFQAPLTGLYGYPSRPTRSPLDFDDYIIQAHTSRSTHPLTAGNELYTR